MITTCTPTFVSEKFPENTLLTKLPLPAIRMIRMLYPDIKTHSFRLIQVIVLALISLKISAQPNNKYVSGAVMAAPNAAALGKYGDIPVNLFTGIPEIKIPIHTVQEGPLSLPVELSYHASGIKVAEMASWVGTGWSLNAGGIITRTVQGIPDESYPYGYYPNGANLPATFDLNIQSHKDMLSQAGQGNLDTEPDLFTFNVGGYSGKFYIDYSAAASQGKPAYTFIPRQDLKLEFNSSFTKFTLIGTDGTRYTFGEAVISGSTVAAREYTHQFGEPSTKTYCSSWYLLKVETPDLKYSINLSYDQEYYSYWNYAPCKQKEFNSAFCPDPQGNTGYECHPTGIDTYHPGFQTEIDGKRLRSISSSTETLDFMATTNRLDLNPDNLHALDAKRLEYVDIKSGSPQVACKRFTFSYDYFTDTTSVQTTSLYKRLRLNQVQESSCGGPATTIPPYVFTYSSNFLPWRMSKATDHWGFYNGALANETQLVSVPSTTLTVPNSSTTVTFGNANKESNETWLKKGMLIAIKYPTGGKTKFTYEANTVQTMVPTTVEKLHLYSCADLYIGNCCGVQTNTSANIQFTSTELQNNNTKFKISLADIPPYFSPPAPSTCVNQYTVPVTVTALRGSDNATMGSYSFNISGNPDNQTVWSPEVNLSYLEGNGITFLANTNYKFRISTTDGYGQLYINSTTSSLQNKTVGGLRIKEIRSQDVTPSANDLVKTYEYLEENSATASSGVLYKMPVYGFNVEGTAAIDIPSNHMPGYISYYQMIFTEQSMVPMFNFEGFHCGYKRVKENHNGNGYKVYTFLYTQSNPPLYTYPLTPDRPSVTLGKPDQERTYNTSNALVASTTSTGAEYGIQVNTGSINKVLTIPLACKHNYLGSEETHTYTGFRVEKYVLLSSVYRLDTRVEMLDGVTTTTNYEYGNFNNYFMPTAEVMTNSDNKVTRKEYKYPYDLTAGCLRDQLLARNIIGEPYEIVTKVGGLQVEGSRKDFASFNDSGTFYSSTSCISSTHVRPRLFYSYEMTWSNGTPTTGTWVLKGTMNSYNTKGSPASFTTANWTDPETYVWTTGGQLQSKTYKSHVITYDYYPGTRLLRSITDIDGRKTGFVYDWLMRLTKSTKDNASVVSGAVVDGNVKTEYTYHFNEVSDTRNWIKAKNSFTAVTGSSLTSTESIEYLDGLGRSQQTVKKGWSPAQKDVVSAVEYDNQGRVTKQYTPFETAVNTGAFATVPGGQTYTWTQYETSPLNRETVITPPGGYAASITYAANTTSEVGYSDGTTLTSYYAANSLFKSTVTKPQSATKNLQTITYKDKKGRVLLSCQKESTNVANTYTLYDDKNRVVKVLPPGVGTGLSESNLRYEYAYDAANHMTYKKIPDMAGINMKFNLRDQLVLTQTGVFQSANKWLLNKYDDYGRPISNGIHISVNPDPNNATLSYNEQHTAYTYSLDKLITSQTWIPGYSIPITRNFTYNSVTGRMVTDSGNNHLTNGTGLDNLTYTYDYAGNVLTEVRAHKSSTSSATLTLTTRSTYDHSGRQTALYHKIDANAEKQLAQYAYDFRDRLIDKSLGAVTSGGTSSFLQSIDYAYNDRNWLTSINGGSSFSALSQSAIALCATNPATPDPAEAAFSSNPDGNDIFKLDLYYETPGFTFGSPTGQRNGNISQLVWQTRGRQRQGYSLQYDFLNRLTSAYYADITSSGTASTDNKFQENVTYDIRGNITSLLRRGLYKDPVSATCYTNGVIDNLSFTYNYASNRIQKITESAVGNVAKAQGFNPGIYATGSSTYSYDVDGNMTLDPYKGASTGMSVTYNHLNLPTNFSFGSNGSMSILYDQLGKKLRRTVSPTTSAGYTQDYVNGLEYRTNSGGALTLEAIYHLEGRIVPLGGTSYQYEYTIKDHLGNERLTFADLNANNVVDVPGDILQENHYYPFGLNMTYSWMNNVAPDNRYQYNSKEYNDDFALNLNDYGARWYDPAIGRWWSIDPLAEKMKPHSPYNYAFNNPLMFVDPDGKEAELPKPTVTQTTRRIEVSFRFDDKGKTKGTDMVKEIVTTQTVQKDDEGNTLYTMNQTQITTTKIDQSGNVGEVSQTNTATIISGSNTTTIDEYKNLEMNKASQEFQQIAKDVQNFKKENSGLSPVQQLARENREAQKVSDKVAGGVGLVGTGLSKVPHPIVKGIGIGLTGLAAGGRAVVAFSYNENPERLKITSDFLKK